jgi:hypothetical protein
VDEGEEAYVDAEEGAPSEVSALKPRLVALLEEQMAALTADEIVALVTDAPPGRVRRALRELSESNEVKRDKAGRSYVHWFPRYSFDLAAKKLRPVLAAVPRVLEGDALAQAHHHARSKFIFFEAEKISDLHLRYLPLHRVKVRRSAKKGFFVQETVNLDATLYLHPHDARVLELSNQAFRFVAAPRESAEAVQDLDQVSGIEFPRTSPGAVFVPPELEPSLDHAQVEAALRRKFQVDAVLGVDLVHLPFWEFKLVDEEKKTTRIGRVDALLGGWLVLEEEKPPEKKK